MQVELYLPANGYYGYNEAAGEDDSNKLPVMVRLRIKNDDASNLGKDMPAGEVAFFVYDSAGSEQKVDSASVDARAKGEPFKLDLRKPSADVKATRRLTFLHQDQPDPEPEAVVTPEGGLPADTDADVEVSAAPTTMGMRPAVVAVAEPEAGKKKTIVKPLFREEERENHGLQLQGRKRRGRGDRILPREGRVHQAPRVRRVDQRGRHHASHRSGERQGDRVVPHQVPDQLAGARPKQKHHRRCFCLRSGE